MPLYPFKCDKCNREEDEFQSANQEHTLLCPRCKAEMRRVFTPATTVVEFTPGWDMGAGKTFDTKRERDTYLSEKGLRKIRC